jgi:tagatose-1,6-bisphosphate aldolase non-catalytic subunit AgaZ/GatZ
MAAGKPAGVACIHLDAAMGCALFGDPRRPALCADFAAEPAVCGDNRQQAMHLLHKLEVLSSPLAGAARD